MGKHRIKMSLCVCFREMAEREGGKKLALRHVLSPSGKSAIHTRTPDVRIQFHKHRSNSAVIC